jgi:hypothetical protein
MASVSSSLGSSTYTAAGSACKIGDYSRLLCGFTAELMCIVCCDAERS